MTNNNTPNYCWIITKDFVADPAYNDKPAVGAMGPSSITPEQEALLKEGKGQTVILKDDDGELCYEARVIDMDEAGLPYDIWVTEPESGPLEDFGMPYAGATQVWINGELAIG